MCPAFVYTSVLWHELAQMHVVGMHQCNVLVTMYVYPLIRCYERKVHILAGLFLCSIQLHVVGLLNVRASVCVCVCVHACVCVML